MTAVNVFVYTHGDPQETEGQKCTLACCSTELYTGVDNSNRLGCPQGAHETVENVLTEKYYTDLHHCRNHDERFNVYFTVLHSPGASRRTTLWGCNIVTASTLRCLEELFHAPLWITCRLFIQPKLFSRAQHPAAGRVAIAMPGAAKSRQCYSGGTPFSAGPGTRLDLFP